MPTTPTGLQYEDTTVADGAEAKAGQHVHVHYTGWLYNDGVQTMGCHDTRASEPISIHDRLNMSESILEESHYARTD